MFYVTQIIYYNSYEKYYFSIINNTNLYKIVCLFYTYFDLFFMKKGLQKHNFEDLFGSIQSIDYYRCVIW